MDAFVALTEYDETNIISALFAQHAGAKQVITLVNKPDYAALAHRIGLDVALSPRLSAANAILRYVRRGSVTGVATFKDGGAEALSITVSAKAPVVGGPIAELRFPKNAIIGAIVRGQEMIIPGGRDQLRAGDTAVVFALPEAVSRVMKLFPS
jgi:trk system potassium uptake protein TrkA